jgi:hypothetical protein
MRHIFSPLISMLIYFLDTRLLSLFQCTPKIDCLSVALLDTAANINHNLFVQTHLVIFRLITVQVTHLC